MFDREDARWLSDTILGRYSAHTETELAQAIIPLARDHFRTNISSCEELSFDLSRYRLHGLRSEVRVPADHAAYLHDHPAVGLLDSGARPLQTQLTRLAPRQQYERTDFYGGLCRMLGVKDQLIVFAYEPEDYLAFVSARDHPFSTDETALMGLIQPHLAAAWKRVRPPKRPLDAALILQLSPGLRPRALDFALAKVLRAYFPRWRDHSVLPENLFAWAKHEHQIGHAARNPLRTFQADSARGRLYVRFYPGKQGADSQMMFLEERAQPDYLRLQTRGLTLRECEVLHWLAQGKRGAEIAAILGTAVRTVEKHVEKLRVKFAASSRAGVVASARRQLSGDAINE